MQATAYDLKEKLFKTSRQWGLVPFPSGEPVPAEYWRSLISSQCPVALRSVVGDFGGLDVTVFLLEGYGPAGVVRIYLDVAKENRLPLVEALREELSLQILHWTFLPKDGWRMK